MVEIDFGDLSIFQTETGIPQVGGITPIVEAEADPANTPLQNAVYNWYTQKEDAKIHKDHPEVNEAFCCSDSRVKKKWAHYTALNSKTAACNEEDFKTTYAWAKAKFAKERKLAIGRQRQVPENMTCTQLLSSGRFAASKNYTVRSQKPTNQSPLHPHRSTILWI